MFRASSKSTLCLIENAVFSYYNRISFDHNRYPIAHPRKMSFMTLKYDLSSVAAFATVQNHHIVHSVRHQWVITSHHSFVMWLINSLAPGKFEWHFRYLIFQIISVIDGWGISCELALRWMSLNLTDDRSPLVQVPEPSWPRSLSPYGVTRPQWVNHTLISIMV